MKKILLVFFLMFFLLSDVYAGKGEDSVYWWRVPKIVEKLNLTQPQINQIEEIFQTHSLQIDDLDKEIIQKEHQLESMLDSVGKNREAKLLSKEVLKLKSEKKSLKLDMLFGIRDVLSVDQRKELKKLKSKHK